MELAVWRKYRWGLLMEGGASLGVAYLLIRCLPFHWWSGWLGARAPGEVNAIHSVQDRRIGDVARTLHAINRRCGGHFTCLMLATAAHWMLARRGIPSSLVLGTRTEVAEDQGLVMQAHAWLRVGPRVVMGAHDGRYVAIASFVRERKATARMTEIP